MSPSQGVVVLFSLGIKVRLRDVGTLWGILLDLSIEETDPMAHGDFSTQTYLPTRKPSKKTKEHFPDHTEVQSHLTSKSLRSFLEPFISTIPTEPCDLDCRLAICLAPSRERD